MKIIERNEDLVQLLDDFNCSNSECILRVYDSKSDICINTIVVKHPILFIRTIQDFCKSASLPVSDVSVRFVGKIDQNSCLQEIPEIVEISPYVYFKKPEEAGSESE